MGNRPFFVTLIGGLNLALGILVLLGAIIFFVMGNTNLHDLGLDAQTIADIEKALSEAGLAWGSMMNIVGAACAIVAIIDIVIGYGMLKGWRIMWYLGVIFNALGVLASIILVAEGAMTGMYAGVFANVVGLVINGIILWYLFKPNVKDFFLV